MVHLGQKTMKMVKWAKINNSPPKRNDKLETQGVIIEYFSRRIYVLSLMIDKFPMGYVRFIKEINEEKSSLPFTLIISENRYCAIDISS